MQRTNGNIQVSPYKALRQKFGITFSNQHIRRLVKAGKFPAPVMLSGTPVWYDELINQHLATLPPAMSKAD